ncbi:MAG TPA: hypothetical protein VFW07_04315 [Parafilimonas sp.]|nr:hypothetical protein [Parafilimonas sp.]
MKVKNNSSIAYVAPDVQLNRITIVRITCFRPCFSVREDAEHITPSTRSRRLIKREVHGVSLPVRVEYSLTDFDKTLVPALAAIGVGKKHGRNKREIG